MKLRRKKHGLQESGIPYVLPALLVVASVMLFPLLYNIVLSFFKKTIYDMNWSFVGLAQYKKLLTSDTFLNALKNTVIWTVVSVFFPIPDRFYLRAGHLAGPDPVPWDLALPNHAGMGLAVCDRKHGLEMDVPFRLRYSQ